MKQYTQPIVTISDADLDTMFLIGSDPTINPDDTSDNMEVKDVTNDFGEYLW